MFSRSCPLCYTTCPPPPLLPASFLHPRSDKKLSGGLSPALGAAWQGLEDLQLYSNELSGALPAEWAAMGKLRRLYLL